MLNTGSSRVLGVVLPTCVHVINIDVRIAFSAEKDIKLLLC